MILMRYCNDSFNQDYFSTIGVDFQLKSLQFTQNDGRSANVKMQIWDTAGQERFRPIVTSYYRGANAVILVYDITNRESFEELRNNVAPEILSLTS